jgi:hypothetical protein
LWHCDCDCDFQVVQQISSAAYCRAVEIKVVAAEEEVGHFVCTACVCVRNQASAIWLAI